MWMLAKAFKNIQKTLNLERGPAESEYADFLTLA